MDEFYRSSMAEHLGRLEEEMDRLREPLLKGELTSYSHRLASERALQLLIEACIGICKQSLKAHGLQVPSDAREALAKLAETGVAAHALDWRRIVGLRNVLVHDYLNTNPEVVEDVYRTRRYGELLDFARRALSGVPSAST